MATHWVKQGDCISSIAWEHGFADWQLIWDAQTDDFRRNHPNPNTLAPGDEVVIPERTPKRVSVATNASHVFKVRRPPTRLRVRLRGDDGKVLSGIKYELMVADKTLSGNTDDDGLVDQPVPANAATATLTLFTSDTANIVLSIRLGHIEPMQWISGVQGRLRNLGYFAGPSDGQADDNLEAALRAFQRDQGIDETGTLDDSTRDKLESAYMG